MEYSAESIRFLHTAYALMALGQIGYIAFLARRWRHAQSEAARAKNSDA